MTRQNQIPTEDGSRVTLALIPLWDMCNHTNGLVTTSSPMLCWIWEAVVAKLWEGAVIPPTHHTPPCCLPSKGTNKTKPATPPHRPQIEAGIFLLLHWLIRKTGSLNLIPFSKATVNYMYLLSHNSSLSIHFLILLYHRLNQSFFLLFLFKMLIYWGKKSYFSFFLLCLLCWLSVSSSVLLILSRPGSLPLTMFMNLFLLQGLWGGRRGWCLRLLALECRSQLASSHLGSLGRRKLYYYGFPQLGRGGGWLCFSTFFGFQAAAWVKRSVLCERVVW